MEIETIKQLLSKVSDIEIQHNELSMLSGENYNIFKITKINEDEVKHSAMIADLLNPKGSHGQGTVFLELFLKQIGFEKFSYDNAVVETEHYIGPVTENTGGSIDIYITDKNEIKIGIENKINAKDQARQLHRYHNYCGKNLFYLTLYGDEPSKESSCNLECEEDFRLLSYESDIIEWLEACKKEATSLPLLREGIAHYINIIKRLTGQSNSTAMKEKIIETIIKNSQTLEATKSIIRYWVNVKTEIQWNFWEALKIEIEKNHIKILENEKYVTKKKVLNYYDNTRKRNKQGAYGYMSEVYSIGDIKIYWVCELGNRFYYGFKIGNKDKNEVNIQKNEQYREILIHTNHRYNIDSKNWLGWKLSEPELNFYNFNNKAIFDLADKDNLIKVVRDIVEESRTDIENFKKEIENRNM